MLIKHLGIRINGELEGKINKLIELKGSETGLKLRKTQIIEMLINDAIKKIESN